MSNRVGIFISCVSDEFGNYRDAIRKDLARPNLDTKIQEDFNAYGSATLEKLDDYIQHCEAVIHMAGDMTGSMANALSIQYINQEYPDFATRFPELEPVLKGDTGLSYTQWEAYLAAYHNKKLFIAKPSEDAKRNTRYKKEEAQATLQQAHLNNLRKYGYYAEIEFTTEDELVKKLYQSKLGDILNAIPKTKPVNLPFKSIETAFKGREPFLQELHELFFTKKTGTTAVAVYGLGGMGKTRLAVEYAWRHANDYTALLFITANSAELVKTSMANLASPQILNLPEYEAKEEEVKYAAVINWLNRYSGWLLVIDNVDNSEAAKKIEEVFAQLQHGHVLITARTDKWSVQIKKKQLAVLDKADAEAFLLETTANERQKTVKDNELATAIALDLGCLALALEQARAYIVTKELSFEIYRKNWEKSRTDVLSWFDEQLMQYPASVAITWQASFNQLSAEATTLLNRLAWFAPEPIPKTLLEVKFEDAENINAEIAWEELKQYSLATSTEDRKAFTVHKLVQDVTRANMNNNVKLKTVKETLNWIDIAFSYDPENVFDWPHIEPLVPHVLFITDYIQTLEKNDKVSELISQVAILFHTKAQYKDAEPLMRKSLEIDELNLGPNHPDVAVRLNNLTLLFQATNRLKEAEPLIRRALEITEQNYEQNHPKIAIRLNNLALLLQDTNRLEEAEPLIRRSLAIDELNFGPNHPNVAAGLSNLALILKETNRFEEIEPLLKRALQIDEQNFDSNHPNIARHLNNLAQLFQATNRLEEAEPLMRRSLEIDEKGYGPNHPKVAIRLNNLAQLFMATNRLEEAEPLIRRAIKIGESLGENNPNAALYLNNLAQLLKKTRRLNEAIPLLKRSLVLFFESYGIDHPNTKKVRTNYVTVLQEMGLSEEEIKADISILLKTL